MTISRFIGHEVLFSLIDWPPQTPHPKPIENLWDCAREEFKQRSNLPPSIQDLAEILIQLWM